MLKATPTYRTMLAVDIERSAGRGDVALLGNRDVLFTALRESCAESGVDWDGCHHDDIGDGMRLIAGPEVSKTRFVHPLMYSLAARLRAHNRTAGKLTTIRVRAALHAGDVHLSDGGFAGGSLEELARLLDAPPLRKSLNDTPSSVTVALIVSDHFHDAVVRHGYVGIDPESYKKVSFTVKRTDLTAWLHLPDGGLVHAAVGADDGQESTTAPPTAPSVAPPRHADDGGTRGMVIHATNVVTGGQVTDMIGQRIDHITGNVYAGAPTLSADGLHAQIAEIRRLLVDLHRDGRLDEDTFAEARTELRRAEEYAASPDRESRNKLVLAMRKLKGLVEEVADLAAKVAAVISAARGA
ncbi:MAG TPA: hypothetical protein VIS06_19075 [Mycobacteriales bacterium]